MNSKLRALGALAFVVVLSGCCCAPPEAGPGAEAGPSALRAPSVDAGKPDARLEAEFQKAEAVAAAKKAEEQSVRDVLAKKRVRGLAWEEVSLDQALTYLRTITGVSFAMSPKVREEKFDDILISAQLDDVSIETLLTVILTEPFELRWEVRDGVVKILTTEEVEGPPRLRYYDVKDVLATGPEFAGKPAGAPRAKPVPQNEGAPFASDTAMVEELQREVFPSYWERENATAEARNGILIVRASGAVHHAIARWLAGIRSGQVKPGLPKELASKFEKVRVTLDVSNSTLADVVKMLQVQTGYNITIDPRIVSDVASNPISGIKLTDVSLPTALTMLQAAAGEHAVWTGKGNVAILTRQEFLGL